MSHFIQVSFGFSIQSRILPQVAIAENVQTAIFCRAFTNIKEMLILGMFLQDLCLCQVVK